MTVAWSVTFLSNDSGDENLSFRVTVPAVQLAAGGNQVRLTFAASTVAGFKVDHVSIGENNAALSSYATAATPIEVLFGGAPGFNLGAGGTITSDWTNYTLDTSKNQVVIFDVSSTNGSPRYRTGPFANCAYKAATDSYNVANPSGFTLQSNVTYGISQIEVQSGGGGGASVAASSGSIGISGKTGSASATANRTVKASAGSLGITGQIGHVIASDAKSVSANSGRIGVSGQGARVAATANVALHATDGSVSIAGQSATVSVTANQTVEVGAGSLGISGGVAAVSVTANQNVRAASGSISVSGQTPSVSVAANVSVAAQAGTVHIAGAGCHVRVTQSASAEASAGRLPVRGQIASVEIGGKHYGGFGPGWDFSKGREFDEERRKAVEEAFRKVVHGDEQDPEPAPVAVTAKTKKEVAQEAHQALEAQGIAVDIKELRVLVQRIIVAEKQRIAAAAKRAAEETRRNEEARRQAELERMAQLKKQEDDAMTILLLAA